jgi:sugar lactone lactonase YvrE
VADQFGNTIRKIDPSGNVTTLAGSSQRGFVNGVGSVARFNNPTGIAVDHDGNVYVSDAGNFVVRKITPAGVVTTLAGNGIRGTANGLAARAQFTELNGIVVDASGTVYVADHDRIRVIVHPRATPLTP